MDKTMDRKRLPERAMVFCLAVILLFTGALSPTRAADGEGEEIVDRYIHTFDGCREESAFTESHGDFGISYVTGRMQVTSENAISGKSVRIHSCDMRWWMVSYSDAFMVFTFDVKFDEQYSDTKLIFNIQNHTPSTTTESGDGGKILAIEPADGVPYLTNRAGDRLLACQTDGSVYSIRIEAAYGSSKYAVYCNDVLLSDENEFVSPIYGVFGMRYAGESGSADSYLTLDNMYFYSKGRSYAQRFSYQEPGALPEIDIPAEPDSGISFWLNNTRISPPAAPLWMETTCYMPLLWTLEQGGAVVAETADGYEARYENRVYSLVPEENSILCDDSEEMITLRHPFTTADDGTLLAPAQAFSLILDAKVWYDAAHEMLVFTTGAYKNDNILRNLGGRFYQNGEPFYEISFNKFDLNWQVYSDAAFNDGKYPSAAYPNAKACLEGAEEALKQLHENGFKTIRVFCNNINMQKSTEEVERFFAASDRMYDLCDQYDIQVVACLGLISEEFLTGFYADGVGWVAGGEAFYDMFCDESSASRQNVYDFIDAYVSRYQDRKTILMWEIQNEGNLNADIGYQVQSITFSLAQLGRFYTDTANRIRQNDPERLVTGGDSILRSAQWHLFAGTMKGNQYPDWTIDTWEERLKCLLLLHEGLDVISVHGYGVGYSEHYLNQNGRTHSTTWELFLNESKRLGRALYNGETGGMMNDSGRPVEYGNTGTEAAQARENYLDSIIDAGVQLTHWWAFHSDRGDFGNDVDSWSVRVDDDTASTFAVIKEANEKLQAKYKVNAIAGENVESQRETGSPLEPASNAQQSAPTGNAALIAGIALLLAGAAAVGVVGILLYRKKIRKGK